MDNRISVLHTLCPSKQNFTERLSRDQNAASEVSLTTTQLFQVTVHLLDSYHNCKWSKSKQKNSLWCLCGDFDVLKKTAMHISFGYVFFSTGFCLLQPFQNMDLPICACAHTHAHIHTERPTRTNCSEFLVVNLVSVTLKVKKTRTSLIDVYIHSNGILCI